MLMESLPSIPAKLVGKIQKVKFVDMAILLWDNVEADITFNWFLVSRYTSGPIVANPGSVSRATFTIFLFIFINFSYLF